ncbi:MAG: hypothetical protein QW112_04105 [Candidatus Micrarchaeia archaeon]
MAEHKMIGKEKEVIIERDRKNPEKEAKFMLIKVKDEGRVRDMIVSMPLSTHPLHKDILSTCHNALQKEGKEVVGHDGGGYLLIDDKKKTIKAYKSSGDFGPADKVLVESILKRNFPGYRILIDMPDRVKKIPEMIKAEMIKAQVEQAFKNLEEKVDWMIEDLPAEAASYMKVCKDQLMRLKKAMNGEAQNGAIILAHSHKKTMEALLKRHPGLESEVYGGRITIIAEAYDTKLVEETLKIMTEMEDEGLVKEAAHILGEMAMLKNAPELYARMLKVLRKNIKNEKILSKILHDCRLEFHVDLVIREALEDYEK